MFRLVSIVCTLTYFLIGLPFTLFGLAILSKDDIQSKALIYDCISAVNGEFCDKETDLVVKGPDDIEITRYYNSKSESDLKGWRVFPYKVLIIGKSNTSNVGYCGEHRGSILPYVFDEGNNEYQIEKSKVFGLINNSSSISGQTNYKNNSIKQIDSETYELLSGDGAKRIYKKLFDIQKLETLFLDHEIFQKISKKVKDYQFFYLDHEILPSGNKRFYKYDLFGQVIKIESKNNSEKNLFGWVDIFYEDQKIIFKTSDQQTIEYHFDKSFSAKKYLLTRVVSSKNPEIHYSYDQMDNLIEKHLPNGSLFKIEYCLDKKEKDYGRVASIYCSSGNNKEINLHNIHYEINKSQKGKIKNGITHAIDHQNVKTNFIYNNLGCIEKIEKYLPNGKLYKANNQKWGSKDNEGNILAEFIEDNSKNILRYKTYKYDAFGNILEETLYGNLTGKNSNPIILDKSGFPSVKENESHIVKSKYSSDGFNVLISRGDCKNSEIKYEYLPNTNLLIKKMICYEDWMKKRFFYKYDENAFLIKALEDDGNEEYLSNDIWDMGITKAFITEIIPKGDFPNFAYPKIILNKCLDTKDGKKHLLNKVVNAFDALGNIISTEVYDADENFNFRDNYLYDIKGNLISRIDRLKNVTTYGYDSNNNLTSQETDNVRYDYKYDNQNNKVEESKKNSDGSSQTSKFNYDDIGNLIAEIDHFGNQTTYEYDSFSRLIKTTYPSIQDENRQRSSPAYTYEYDVFDNVIKIIDPKNYITKKTYNSRDQEVDIAYPDKTSEKYSYDMQGTLHRKLLRDSTVWIYQYDFLGRIILEEHFASSDTGPGFWLGDKLYEYDAFNLIYFSENEGSGIKYKYNSKGQLIWKIAVSIDSNLDRKGPKTSHEYDSLGRVICEKKWYGKGKNDYYQIRKKYDIFNNLTDEIIEDSNNQVQTTKSFEYDIKNRLIATYEGNQIIEKSSYDDQDQIISSTDAKNHITSFEYDYASSNLLGQKVLTLIENQPNGNRKVIEYDALNNISLVTIKNPSNLEIFKEKYFYDALGNLSNKIVSNIADGTEVSNSQTKWFYGPMNRLEKVIEGYGFTNEKETRLEYNKLGQLVKKYIPGISKPISYKYGYDNEYSPNILELAYCPTLKVSYPNLKMQDGKILEGKNALSHMIYFDKQGRVIRAESPNKVLIERKYNDFGFLQKEHIKNGKISDYEIIYRNDRQGRVTGIKLPDSSKMEYEYFGYLPKKVIRLDKDGKEKYIHEYNEFDEKGNLIQETLIGISGERKNKFDKLNRKIAIETDYVQLKIDECDSSGNILKLTKNNTQNIYSYDFLDQLTDELGSYRHSYKYDSLNNMKQIDNKTSFVNESNELVSIEDIKCEYDPRGMLYKKNDDDKTLTFLNNAFGNLTDIVCSDQYKIKYRYDIFGRRLSKEYTSENEKLIESFIYIGNQEIGTIEEDKNINQLQVPGAFYNLDSGRAIAFELNDEILSPIYDFQGNTIYLVDYYHGDVVESYDYSVFGEEKIFDENHQ